MKTLCNQRILILGLGQSGLAVARFCSYFGAHITVLDTRLEPPKINALKQINAQAVVVNSVSDEAWHGFDRIICSPGLSPYTALVQQALVVAQQCGITVDSEIELFAQALHDLADTQQYTPKILGITGTNGKTTTTALTKLLIEKAGSSVVMAGNVSPAALDALLDAIIQEHLPDVWVLELSSFQLFATRSLQCHAATVLNVTQDHLDWHQTMLAYVDAKARIFTASTIRVLNRDDAVCVGIAKNEAEHAEQTIVWFGLDQPAHAGEYGLSRESGLLWLSYAEPQPLEGGRRKKGEAIPFLVKNLMPADALHIRGLHNATNALAALALCRAIDLPIAKLLHGLRQYHGEPHRVQWVACINEVDYFDDSKGTNVGATVAALNGLARRVVLIAGGNGKGQDFTPLLAPVKQFARALVVLGQDADLIAKEFHGQGVLIEYAASLEVATQMASRLAQSGDAVVLSPACSSLDMFSNYEHRAEVFTQTVRELAAQVGQPC